MNGDGGRLSELVRNSPQIAGQIEIHRENLHRDITVFRNLSALAIVVID